MSLVSSAFDAEWRADGNLWISVNAWMLALVILTVVLCNQFGATKLIRICGVRRREVLFPVSVVILAYFVRVLVAPAPRLGVQIGAQHYEIAAWQFRASREVWFVGEVANSELEAIHVAADQLASSFALLQKDDSVVQYLGRCAEPTQTWVGRTTLHVKHHLLWVLQEWLAWSRTDASALVSLGTAHVASEEQLQRLFQEARNRTTAEQGVRPEWEPQAILDVVAGDGAVTQILANAFDVAPDRVRTWDVLAPLRKSLAASGYHAAQDFEELATDLTKFDIVSVVNVLDRSDDPQSLIESAFERLQSDGMLLVATVLPFCGHVSEGRRRTRSRERAPRVPLRVYPGATCDKTKSFEVAAAAFVAKAFASRPLKMLAWTRLPYLSPADAQYTHIHLDMAVFVLQRQVVIASTALTGNASVQEAASALHEVPRRCKRNDSPIFTWLSKTLVSQGVQSWGDVLDAGTGFRSLCWLLRQRYRSITGVTADRSGTYGHTPLVEMISSVIANASILIGNWRDEHLLHGREYDIVVADYLLGAIERYWPYGADEMLDRVLQSVKPGGYALVVGIEPYELSLDAEVNPQDAIVLDVEAIGDAAALLAGRSSYRELPEDWVIRHIRRREGFATVATKRFPMKLGGKKFFESQLGFARKEAGLITDAGLREAIRRRISELRAKERSLGIHDRAHNYAVVVQRKRGLQ